MLHTLVFRKNQRSVSDESTQTCKECALTTTLCFVVHLENPISDTILPFNAPGEYESYSVNCDKRYNLSHIPSISLEMQSSQEDPHQD